MKSHQTRWCTAGAVAAALAVLAGCSTIGADTTSTTASRTGTANTTAGAAGSSSAGSSSTPIAVAPSFPAEKREFMFQVDRYDTQNQGGQTLNMYFHYRYDDGIADTDIPNYIDLRTQAVAFMDSVDASQNPYWETLNKQLCGQLHDSFPIEAISCQLQVYPDERTGTPYEPGFHSSIDTIGDIEPLAVVGPVSVG